jgi:hypothetical protein
MLTKVLIGVLHKAWAKAQHNLEAEYTREVGREAENINVELFVDLDVDVIK